MAKIYVVSLDFDGCLSQKYNRTASSITEFTDRFITENPSLLDELKTNIENSSNSKLFIGSRRQAIQVDFENALGHRNGSCYTAFRAVSERLGITFDTMILNDIYHGVDPGTTVDTFLKVVDELNLQDTILKDLDHHTPIFKRAEIMALHAVPPLLFTNSSKINLLYAQMHKVATENSPDDEILFDFFDDNDDILVRMYNFFNEYPSLIPKNLSLRLFRHAEPDEIGNMNPLSYEKDTGEFLFDAEIKGTGVRDKQYYETVKDMGEIAAERMGITIAELQDGSRRNDFKDFKGFKGFNMSGCITPELLAEKRAARELEKEKDLDLAVYKFFGLFREKTDTPAEAVATIAPKSQSTLPTDIKLSKY